MNAATIDWLRLAEPQADGYDTQISLEFAARSGYQRPEFDSASTFLGGAISLRHDPDLLFPDDCIPADPLHPNVARAEALLRLWPEGYEQSRRLLDSITLFRQVPTSVDLVVGSICGPGTHGFGSIAVTVDHHVGFAEGIVHEMAHHKLRALGVDVETAERLILNPSNEMYPSPIRYDCLRPMTAVIHAQYSYTYILQLDLKILEAQQDTERDRCIVTYSLAIIVPKLEFGLKILRKYVHTDDEGNLFLQGLYMWSNQILDACNGWLKEYRVSCEKFTHPIAL